MAPPRRGSIPRPQRTPLPRIAAICVGLCVLTSCLWSVSPTIAAETFYTGKTVRILVGFGPGGGYDLYARTLGRFFGRHLAASLRSSCRTCRAPAASRS